jgi:S-adenosylhomocysteine hydrolase
LAFDNNLSLTYGIYKENSKELDGDKKIDNINYYINILQNIPESKDMKMPAINIDAASINSKLNEMYGTKDSSNAVDISNDETIKGILNSLS